MNRPGRIVLPALVVLAAASCGRAEPPTAASVPSRDAVEAVSTASPLRSAPTGGPSGVTRTLDRKGGDLARFSGYAIATGM